VTPGHARPAWCAVVVACADLLAGTLACAGEKPVADAALLEFLGSVDSNVPGWHKYRDDADDDKGDRRAATVPVKSSRSPDPPPVPTAPAKEPPQ